MSNDVRTMINQYVIPFIVLQSIVLLLVCLFASGLDREQAFDAGIEGQWMEMQRGTE